MHIEMTRQECLSFITYETTKKLFLRLYKFLYHVTNPS